MAKELAEFIDNATGNASPTFSGKPWYNSLGDCIHFHWRDEEFYRDWLDDKLTVYRSIHDDQAVGCQIKGVHALLRKLGEFGIAVNQPNGVPLAIFLFASHVAAKPDETKIVEREQLYRYIVGKAGPEKISVPALAESEGCVAAAPE